MNLITKTLSPYLLFVLDRLRNLFPVLQFGKKSRKTGKIEGRNYFNCKSWQRIESFWGQQFILSEVLHQGIFQVKFCLFVQIIPLNY